MGVPVDGAAPRRWQRWLLPVAIAIVIFTITSWPRPPSLPGSSDKLVHFSAYAALGASVAWASGARAAGPTVRWMLFVSALGAIDEWHQQFIPSRSMDVRDWVADTAGAVGGLSLVAALSRRRESVA